MPKKECAFRLKGKHQDGFKALMAKFKKNEWIRKSNSAWEARAFVVPKPGRPGEFRMVVDYRHLNQMTGDVCHPIPNIEDRVSAESLNFFGRFLTLRMSFIKCTFPRKHPPSLVL